MAWRTRGDKAVQPQLFAGLGSFAGYACACLEVTCEDQPGHRLCPRAPGLAPPVPA